MNTNIYRFKLGDFQCIAVNDGTATYAPPVFPPPAMLLFANASKECLERTLPEHNLYPEQWVEWDSPHICLAVNTGDHQVLVDTGGDGFPPNTGKLVQKLKSVGITPEDIDTVIITHGHPDHIGGTTDSEGKPAFPNARYLMWQHEWDFWTSGQAETWLAETRLDERFRKGLLKSAPKHLLPIQGQLELIDHEAEIVPGIRAVAAHGHTPGHMVLAISSEGDQLLHISDLVIHPIHLEQPEWYAAVDVNPEQAIATRHQLLNRAAAEKALVLAFHFPFPGLGRVVQKGETWHWQPLEMTA